MQGMTKTVIYTFTNIQKDGNMSTYKFNRNLRNHYPMLKYIQ